MSTRLPVWLSTNAGRSTRGSGEEAGAAGSFLTSTVIGCLPVSVTPAGLALAGAAGEASGVTWTGGKTPGRKVSSLGANFAASSLVANSIATKTSGTLVRAGQVANKRRAA